MGDINKRNKGLRVVGAFMLGHMLRNKKEEKLEKQKQNQKIEDLQKQIDELKKSKPENK